MNQFFLEWFYILTVIIPTAFDEDKLRTAVLNIIAWLADMLIITEDSKEQHKDDSSEARRTGGTTTGRMQGATLW